MCTVYGVQIHIKVIWHWGADNKDGTVFRAHRFAEQHVCASVTVENVRWSSWRSLRAAHRESPAPRVATRDSDASVTCRRQRVKHRLKVSGVSACMKKIMLFKPTDLISHGSQQVSNWVSFICSEPPQIWNVHEQIQDLILHLLEEYSYMTLCGHVSVRTCLQRHRNVHPPVGSNHRSSCGLQSDHNRTVCWFFLYAVAHILHRKHT